MVTLTALGLVTGHCVLLTVRTVNCSSTVNWPLGTVNYSSGYPRALYFHSELCPHDSFDSVSELLGCAVRHIGHRREWRHL